MTILQNLVFATSSLPGSPEDVACRFFTTFKLFHLDVQYRSIDAQHSLNLAQLRTMNPTVYPFTRSVFKQYKALDPSDILSDPEWLIAPVVVVFNQLRHAINLEGLKLFAKAARYPVICWRHLLHGSNAAMLTSAESTQLYTTHPALSGFFVPGAPAYGRTNTNTFIGLFNGARMNLHSLILDKCEDRISLNTKLQAAQPGDLVLLQYPPFSVQVQVTDAPIGSYTPSDSLIEGKFVVPILIEGKSRTEMIKPWELLRRSGKAIGSIKYRAHSYELGFSLTYEKVQSKSFKRLVLDLQSWPKMTLTAEKMLVGFSRVEKLDHLRILPFGPGQTEQHLYGLKPSELMIHWFLGFGPDGIWSAQRSAQSIAKHPISKKKKSASSSKSSKTTHWQSPKTSAKSTDSAHATGASFSSVSMSTQVVSQFRINLSHAPPSDPARFYHAFAIPGDGHCLFNSFRRSLLLQDTVATLRQQMIDFISGERDAMKRLSALNAHISREQEHQNPAWADVELLDPGTDFSPGVMDIRFSALWVKYSDEMTTRAWAGNLTLTCSSFCFIS